MDLKQILILFLSIFGIYFFVLNSQLQTNNSILTDELNNTIEYSKELKAFYIDIVNNQREQINQLINTSENQSIEIYNLGETVYNQNNTINELNKDKLELIELIKQGLFDSIHWQIDAGFYEINGQIPCQTDGGLKCFGHPIGATGCRMLYEVTKQLQGRADGLQVKDPKLGLTHNLGGAYTVASVTILGKNED